MTCGIYLGAPIFSNTSKVYIGQSIDIEGRILRHKYKLASGMHTKKLQDAYIEFGIFSWEIIKECTEEALDEQEEYYIKLFNAYTDGFNSYENSSDAPILYGIENGRVTDSLITLYSNILNVTITNPTYSKNKVAELLNIEPYIVSHVWYGSCGSWLINIYPEEYCKVQTLRNNRKLGGSTAAQQGIDYPNVLNTSMESFKVTNVRKFAEENSLDKGDLNKLLNKKKPYTKGWILQDLDILDPKIHNKFYSVSQGKYRVQFDLYKLNRIEYGTSTSNKSRI